MSGNTNAIPLTGSKAKSDKLTNTSLLLSSVPRILLMGPRRNGKTSIRKVVFEKTLLPPQTISLDETSQIEIYKAFDNDLVPIEVWDFPGDYTLPSILSDSSSSSFGSRNFVRLNNGSHIVDEEEFDINGDDENGMGRGNKQQQQNLSSQSSSVYAKNIFVVNSMNEKQTAMVSEESIFTRNTSIVYIIDAQNEISRESLGIMRDTVICARKYNPNIHVEIFIHKVDGDLFALDYHKFNCQSEYQEIINREFDDTGMNSICDSFSYSLTSIYDHTVYEALSKVIQKLFPQHGSIENMLNLLISACDIEKAFLFDVVSKLYIATDHNAVDNQTYQLCSDMLDLVMDISTIYGTASATPANGYGSPGKSTSITREGSDLSASVNGINEAVIKRKINFDKSSASVVRLTNNMVLYLRHISHLLAIVCLVHVPQFEKRGLIDYNIDQLQHSLQDLFKPSTSEIDQSKLKPFIFP